MGGGGYAGSVSFPDDAASAGYAAAATDTGHTGSGGDWAWSPTGMKWNLIEDFAFRSLHELTVKGKAVTRAFYGESPAYAYWNGCSTGGRQGLMEAQRFPDDYDGIVSAAPAINWDRFIPAGGKLIIWHGWADSLIFGQGSIDYYERVVRKMGGPQRTGQFARLFMAPGVDHCGGGSGAAPTDPLAALVAWVEQGKAPDSLPGQSVSGMTRPLCVWPEVPRYKGHGSTAEATSFRCSARY